MTALGNRVAMETVQRPVNSISEFSEVEKTTGPMRYGLGPSPDGYRQAADCRAEWVALFAPCPIAWTISRICSAPCAGEAFPVARYLLLPVLIARGHDNGPFSRLRIIAAVVR